jgi:hypothetical protein
MDKNEKLYINLLLTNIEKMDGASLIELHTSLKKFKTKNGFKPTIIGVTETWEEIEASMDYSLEGYTYIGKPIERNPGATRGHGGTGAWILSTIYNQYAR